MGNSTARDSDVSRLHPAIRDKVRRILGQLDAEGVPFEVYEAFRTPERQALLYAQGRTREGPKVTWVVPWMSVHQYGLAVDLVLKDSDGNWSWEDTGARAAYWARMHELAEENGMTPLRRRDGRLILKPHIELAGVSSRDLREGKYPDGGDAVWAEHLSRLIDNWDRDDAPPKPEAAPAPPGLDEDLAAELEGEVADRALPSDPQAMSLSEARNGKKFQRLNAFIKQWEGGFVNNPNDVGGPTNMGITQGMLASWRGADVATEDVQRLTRPEADAIMKANYYDRCRCGEMPDRTAMVVYNAAVMQGPEKAILMLQQGFNGLGMTANGAPLELDGTIGPKTMAGARQTDPSVLAEAIMAAQESSLREHDSFDKFGGAWIDRLNSLRDFVQSLPPGEGLVPQTVIGVGATGSKVDKHELLGSALAGHTLGADDIGENQEEELPPLVHRKAESGSSEDLLLRRVYYGTNRKKIDQQASNAAYGPGRGNTLHLGYSDISIPKNRIPGTIDRPQRLRFWKIPLPIKEKEDINKHFVEYQTKELSEQQFRAEITKAAKADDVRGSAIAYIHGFNNSFQQAMFRAAQLGEDLKFDGLVFAFSWPARGGLFNYVTDLDSALLAVGHLDYFLDLIVDNSGITTLHLIVHSMGNALLSHLMERAGTKLSKREDKYIDQLVLAAPDIDCEVFKQVAAHFKRHAKAVTLYASSNDIALNASEKLRAAYPRAGDVPNGVPLMVDGVDTMDVSIVESGLFELKHSTYGDSDRVLDDVIDRIKGFKEPPDKRLTGVDRVTVPSAGFYYKFKPVKR